MAGGPKTNNGGGAAKPKRVVLTKNQKKRLKKKEKRAAAATEPAPAPAAPAPPPKKENVVVEYVSAAYDADAAASLFKDVFAKFASAEELTTDTVEEVATDAPAAEKASEEVEEDAPEKRLSRKQRKAMSRMTVAELKQVVARPEAVEAHDVTASDPRLLVFLKSYRNTVPVPRHWCHKRKFLQGKRGVEKKPFQLPEYIAQTGPRTSVVYSCAPRRRRDVGPVAASARGLGGREDDDENHASNSYPCLSARRQNGVQGVIERFGFESFHTHQYNSHVNTPLTF